MIAVKLRLKRQMSPISVEEEELGDPYCPQALLTSLPLRPVEHKINLLFPWLFVTNMLGYMCVCNRLNRGKWNSGNCWSAIL